MIMISTKSLSALCARKEIKSHAELARLAKLQPVVLSRVVNGKSSPTMRTIDKICNVLECQPGAILEWVPEPK